MTKAKKPTRRAPPPPPPPNVKVVTTEAEARAAMAAATGPTVLQFTASWCGQCPAEKKKADKLAASVPALTVVRVDEEVGGALLEEYRVDDLGGYPTMFYAPTGAQLKPGMEEGDLGSVKKLLVKK